MDTLMSFLGILLDFLGPILVVIVTVRSEKNKKVEDLQRKQGQEERARREAELDKKIADLQRSVETVTTRLNTMEASINSQISDLKEFDKETKESIKQLSSQHQINGQYVYELAKLVTVLAEGMRDQHMDGNVTQAVNSYRKFESETLSKLMSKPVVDE